MYIDKYKIENYGSTWNNGKEKKNQLVGSMVGEDLVDLRKLVPLLEQWFETVTGGWSDKKVELTIDVKEEK